MEEGLFLALKPAVEVCDQQIRNVVESQNVLQTYIQGLSAELSKAPITDIPGLKDYNVKLANTRKRLANVATTVDRINHRLESIRSLVRKKGALGAQGPKEVKSNKRTDSKEGKDEPEEKSGLPSISDLLDWEDST
ncbi:hypothetical protein AAMO2058_001046100 [Amorphochlora amoebiformis]|mmetsp:Transcript_10472/g.16539  ORF Transcript_10472/g.16539 Transcript_10472/m.16539 type:complete len:136 (-) Transcript_10472:132-539(-)|eukprot:342379-Amorphochlora_amoeboformis.AAC.2